MTKDKKIKYVKFEEEKKTASEIIGHILGWIIAFSIAICIVALFLLSVLFLFKSIIYFIGAI